MTSADIVVGLAYGDEGKGATTDKLAVERKAKRVVRFNGGQQAEHNVIANGRHHTFSSYGSGTLAGVPTFIGPKCTTNPLAVAAEARHLSRVLTTTTRRIQIHESALVTTQLHIMMNHWRETARGDARHGSTGTGFGETIAWEYDGNEPLRMRDLSDFDRVHHWLDTYVDANPALLGMRRGLDTSTMAHELMGHAVQVYDVLSHDKFMSELGHGHTIFEGAQGFMLDEDLGTWPHNTWSATTPKNALTLCTEAGISDVVKWGCLRTYATRHGAGPFPGEGVVEVPEPHNATTQWAGAFRTGAHSADLLRWAIETTKVDVLSLSWADAFGYIVTDTGPASPSDFGVVGMTANGPDRANRQLTL